MKLVLTFLYLSLVLIATPSLANEVFSTRIVSTDMQSLDLPEGLRFEAEKIHVINPAWYTSIFEERGCESSLSEVNLNSRIEIKAQSGRSMSLSIQGHPSARFAEARASYIPMYYKFSMPVHPHFMVKLKDWVLLHVVIHRSGDKKHLTVSLIQGGKAGQTVQLVPILEADGR